MNGQQGHQCNGLMILQPISASGARRWKPPSCKLQPRETVACHAVRGAALFWIRRHELFRCPFQEIVVMVSRSSFRVFWVGLCRIGGSNFVDSKACCTMLGKAPTQLVPRCIGSRPRRASVQPGGSVLISEIGGKTSCCQVAGGLT